MNSTDDSTLVIYYYDEVGHRLHAVGLCNLWLVVLGSSKFGADRRSAAVKASIVMEYCAGLDEAFQRFLPAYFDF